MQGFEYHAIQTATIATDGSITTAIHIGGANRVSIECPTFSVGVITATANIFVHVANTSDGTFRILRDMGTYSANSGLQQWELPSSTGNCNVLCRPAVGYNYMKIQQSNTSTANAEYVVHKLH